MAPNKRKMLESARKYAQKGAKERALKEYEQLLKLDPRDAKLRLEVGDAYRRWGQTEESVACYRRVAEQYAGEGFDARAVAVYKQIQNLDPAGYAACEPLAELYQRMGLNAEAIAALQAAADGHARDGNKRAALDLLRRMVGLDPANTASRSKVADLLRQEKLLDEAAVEYEALCTELERQGETEAAGRAIERWLEVAPDRVDVLTRLARNLLARGKPDQAEAPARRATERDPQEIAHHELLAEIHRAQKRDDKLIDTYRKIAELYRLRGDAEKARVILQRFVPMDSFEAPAREVEPAPMASPFGADALELDAPDADRDLLDDGFLDDPAPVTRPSAPPQRPAAPARPAPAARAPEAKRPPAALAAPGARAEETVFELGAEEGSRILGDPEQLLAEASVYLRYGKRGPAIENLQAILGRDPHHRGALEKLGDAYADDGDAAGAVAAWLRAGELARDEGDLESMALLRDRVAALDAAAAATLEVDDEEDVEVDVDDPLLEIESDADGEDASSPVAPVAADVTANEIEIDVDGIGWNPEESDAGAGAGTAPAAGPVGEDEEFEIDVDLDLDAADPAEGPSEPSDASDPEGVAEALEEAEFYLQQGLATEARALFERVLEGSPGHPLALVRLGELAAAAGGDPDAPGAASAPPHAAPPELHATAPAPASGAEPAGAWLAGDEDPFVDDEEEAVPAEESPVALDAGDGDERAAEAVCAAPSAEAGTGDPVDAAPAPAVADGGAFDLAAELSAALDEMAANGAAPNGIGDEGFREVFGAFKRGVEATLGRHDHEAHYDLGIAYREMGLLDDAVAEFRSAMASPARRIDCLHMLGLCALAQGRADEAIDCLSHALAAPDLDRERDLAIRFELGRAYEQGGDAEKARAAWEKVASVDPDFCEVGELLATLAGRSAAPAGEFESFGDLLAEADADPDPGPPTRSRRPVPASPEPPEPVPTRRPRRRKISFV